MCILFKQCSKDDNDIQILDVLANEIQEHFSQRMEQLLAQITVGVWNSEFLKALKDNPVLSQFKSMYITESLESLIDVKVDIISVDYKLITPNFVQENRGLGKVSLCSG
jgi:hypothetical protein